MSTLSPITSRPESITEMVHMALREAIVSRSLAPGDKVTEASLAAQLSVSKTPVREALLKLEYIGLIQPDGRRGGRVVIPSRETIRAAYELRIGLEAQSARILAERNDPELIAAARQVAETCLASAKSGDRAGFRRFDRMFHLALADATDNPALQRFIHDAFDLTWTLRRRDVPGADDSLSCAKQHLDVVKAIEGKDPEGADRAMRKHLDKVQKMVLAAFDAHDG